MPSKEKKYYTLLLLFWGSALSITQTVILREFLCTVDGNEVAVGISLALWLGFNAVGALIWYTKKNADIKRFMYILLIGLLSGLISVVVLRYFRLIYNLPPAGGMGIKMTIISALFAYAPPALISGYSFPFICGVFPGLKTKERVGYIYAIESLGLVLGFLAIVLLLNTQVGHLTIISIGYIASILTLLVIYGFFTNRHKLISFFIVGALVAFFVLLTYLDITTIRVAFDSLKTGFNFKSYTETHYNRYIIAQREGQTAVFSNNHFLKNIGDEYSHRVFAHFIMTVAKASGDVLLIGEGSYDLIGHISEHRPTGIDYIEYDPKLSKFIMKGANGSIPMRNEVHIIAKDGRYYVQNASQKYAVVFLDVSDPINLQLNRFFTFEFFSEVRSILIEDGILALTLPSVASVPSEAKREYLRSVFGALKSTFKFVLPLQSERTYVIASNNEIDIQLDGLIQRFNSQRNALSCGFEPELFSLVLEEDANKRLAAILAPPYKHINSDFSPYGFFSNMVLWEMSTSESGNSLLSYIRRIGFIEIFTFILVVFLLAYFVKRYRGTSYVFQMFWQGFFAIAVELIVIYRFQLQYGTLYYFIALLFSAFMTGLGAGSFLGKFYRFKISYLFGGNILVVAPLLWSRLPFFVYILLLVSIGLLTGVIFGAISAININGTDGKSSVIRVASILDYADSAGATIAALFTTIVLLPSIGPILSVGTIGVGMLLLFLYSL